MWVTASVVQIPVHEFLNKFSWSFQVISVIKSGGGGGERNPPWFPGIEQQFNTNILPLEKKSVVGNKVTKLQGDFDKNLITILALYLFQRH